MSNTKSAHSAHGMSRAERLEVRDGHGARERRLALAQLQQVVGRRHVVARHGEHQLAAAVAREDLGHQPRQDFGQRVGKP